MSVFKSIFTSIILVLIAEPALAFAFKNPAAVGSSSSSSFKHRSLHVRGGNGINNINNIKKQASVALQLSPAAASLFAGSMAGAIGVGVAFPLDTLKTKSQVLSQQDVKMASSSDSLLVSTLTSTMDVSNMNMLQLMSFIYGVEGLRGFFGGVKVKCEWACECQLSTSLFFVYFFFFDNRQSTTIKYTITSIYQMKIG